MTVRALAVPVRALIGGPIAIGLPPELPAVLEQGEHLDGLAQPHVVGEAPAEAESAEELHPAKAVALVVAQLADEALRGVERVDAVEAHQLVPRLPEGCVEGGLRHR